jgi:hypothetical protein
MGGPNRLERVGTFDWNRWASCSGIRTKLVISGTGLPLRTVNRPEWRTLPPPLLPSSCPPRRPRTREACPCGYPRRPHGGRPPPPVRRRRPGLSAQGRPRRFLARCCRSTSEPLTARPSRDGGPGGVKSMSNPRPPPRTALPSLSRASGRPRPPESSDKSARGAGGPCRIRGISAHGVAPKISRRHRPLY